jgi:hypothetical protein
MKKIKFGHHLYMKVPLDQILLESIKISETKHLGKKHSHHAFILVTCALNE